jgi:tetratricopeptide (TPR) repeat protein
MVKDIEKQFMKAEKLYNAMQYKRAAKLYDSVGDSYLSLGKFELARDCYFDAAKCCMNEDKYLIGIDFLRKAGNASLHNNHVLEAAQFYREAVKYIPNLRSTSDRNQSFILFSCLSYLCHFIKGEHEEGLKLVKKIKSYVDDAFFKENPLIRLITSLTIVQKEKKEKYIERIKKDFTHLKIREAEIQLVKKALVIAKTYTSLVINLNFDKDVYTTNEPINLTLDIDTSPLLEISKQDFYNYDLKDLKISKFGITLSDNLTSQKNPELPILIEVGQKRRINLVIKPHFQMENPFVGPILITAELNEDLNFTYEISQLLKPNLISPPPTLEISTKNLRPPLIDQTFPLEILIENKSAGDALNLNVDVEFPEEIKVMRGTLKKQIYSLRSNENIKWEINLKPTEAGDYIFKVSSKFNDPDQNVIGDVKEFPLSIKL